MSLFFFLFFWGLSCPTVLMKFSLSTYWVSYSAGVTQRSFTEANRIMWIYTSWESGLQILRQTNNSQWIIYKVNFTWFSVYENLWFILHSMQNCFTIFHWAKNPSDCRYLILQVMCTLFIDSWVRLDKDYCRLLLLVLALGDKNILKIMLILFSILFCFLEFKI